jgi:hypothetical protein
LELALASVAGKSGNLELYENALLRAIHYQPNVEDTAQLGEFYLTHNRFEPAILMLQKAIEMNPDSAASFFDLDGRTRPRMTIPRRRRLMSRQYVWRHTVRVIAGPTRNSSSA